MTMRRAQARQIDPTGKSLPLFGAWQVKTPERKYSCLCFTQITSHQYTSRPAQRGVRTSRTWGGERWTRRLRRRAQPTRTAKACGPDVAVLASSLAVAHRSNWIERDICKAMVTRKPDHQGERAISRKAIAQGMSDCLRCPVCSCAHFLVHIAHETAGAARIRHSLRPLTSRGAKNYLQTSGRSCRENADAYLFLEN